jgi:hypothetical protein
VFILLTPLCMFLEDIAIEGGVCTNWSELSHVVSPKTKKVRKHLGMLVISWISSLSI